ncbi:MAG: MjaI family restriction endonuclease, partial [Prevotellaceae bacterium]|nr:MjaI family restriction endonuclease [Prevotellaceae bacterium]
MPQQKHSLYFGKKEKVLNYACQTYQLSRPNKVGAVMALIRECQPKTIEECQQSYFRRHSYGMPVTCRQNISTERCKPTVCKER